jgi:hypothetical protein
MNRNKANTLIVLAIIAGAAGTGGFLAWFFLTGQNYPACTTTTPFIAYPANMTRIKSIAPLGNLNPPGHTFPTDHMYFYGDLGLYPDGFQIFAPGNLTITRLATVHYDPPQGVISDDYTIEFRVCRELSGKFGHVNNLSTLLWGKISSFGSAGDGVQTWTVAGRTFTSYQKDVSIPVSAGDLLGVAGLGGGYDFWLKDTRVTMSWVNQNWPREFQNTACPLSYFTPALESGMKPLLKDYSGNPVDPAGYCGKIDFDVGGTAQGILVRGDYSPSGSTRAEDIGLALVYSNFNASKAAISIGIAGSNATTYAWDESVYTFTPAHAGYGNRAFDEVTADGNVYYYFCEQFGTPGSYIKAILVKMDDASHVRLQFVDNGGLPLPSNPSVNWSEPASVVYYR